MLEAFAFIPSLLWGLIRGSGEDEKSCQHHINGDTHEFLPPWNVIRGHDRPWIGAFETQASSYPVQHQYHQSLLSNFHSPQNWHPQASHNSSSLLLGWMRTRSFIGGAECLLQGEHETPVFQLHLTSVMWWLSVLAILTYRSIHLCIVTLKIWNTYLCLTPFHIK